MLVATLLKKRSKIFLKNQEDNLSFSKEESGLILSDRFFLHLGIKKQMRNEIILYLCGVKTHHYDTNINDSDNGLTIKEII